MRNRLILIIMLLSAGWRAAAQIPSLTSGSKIRFVEGNTVFDRPVSDLFATGAGLNLTVTGNWTFSSSLTLAKDAGFYLYDDADATKLARFQASGITTSTVRNFTLPNADGTLALTSNSSGLVDLTSSVTGALPVANGGTGATTFTNNRLLTGNGTSAIVAEANATFDGTTLAVTGKETISGTASYSSDDNFLGITGTATTTANGVDISGVNSTIVAQNDGTPTSNSFRGGTFSLTTNTTTAGILYGVVLGGTNTSPNASQFYGLNARIDENSATGNLSSRYGMDFLVVKGAQDATDAHTATGIRVRLQESTSTGRWSSGTGASIGVENALTGTGAAFSVSNSKGTNATQYGATITNTAYGSGVTVANAYGIRFIPTETSLGSITNYYSLFLNTSPVATTSYFLYNSVDYRNYLNGNLAIGVDATTAKLFVRGSGTTSSTYSFIAEKSDGTDIVLVRDDGMSAFGTTPTSTETLTVRGSTSNNTTKALVVERASGTDVLGVQNDGKVSINNAAYTEELTINGQAQMDNLVLNTSTASNTATGNLTYTDDATHGGYLTLGDGDRQLALMPTMIERQVIDWAVDWTTGRKGAFWTVPARFNGWKISKVYIECTAVGSGAGDDVLEIEINSVTEGTQTVTALTHTLVMDDAIATNDLITVNPTSISATPAKGLNVSFELRKN